MSNPPFNMAQVRGQLVRAKKAREVIICPDSGKKKYIYGPQKHRRVWEKIPQLKDWLQPSHKAEHYSYCTYCDKHLKANRRSLLDHAKSRVHLDMMPGGPGRPGRRRTLNNVPLPLMENEMRDHIYDQIPACKQDPDEVPDDDYDDSFIEGNGCNFVTTEMDNCYEDDDEDVDSKGGIILPDHGEDNNGEFSHDESLPQMSASMTSGDPFDHGSGQFNQLQPHKPLPAKKENSRMYASNRVVQNHQSFRNKSFMSKFPVSTHILDTMHGCPAQGVSVTLSRFHEDDWAVLGSGITNADGRYQEFLPREYFIPGRYKIHFYVEDYFKKISVDFFYPFIEIVFDVKDASEHFHVPLLLNAFGYTTYRGS